SESTMTATASPKRPTSSSPSSPPSRKAPASVSCSAARSPSRTTAPSRSSTDPAPAAVARPSACADPTGGCSADPLLPPHNTALYSHRPVSRDCTTDAAGVAPCSSTERHLIVLSYRRADSPGFARALRERLVRELGADRIFLDVETIEAGEDFREGLRTAVSTAEALVVVIGPEWLGPPPAANRLHNDDDAIRLEIATALSAGVPVVPVLVDGATMPDADVLPDDVR